MTIWGSLGGQLTHMSFLGSVKIEISLFVRNDKEGAE